MEKNKLSYTSIDQMTMYEFERRSALFKCDPHGEYLFCIAWQEHKNMLKKKKSENCGSCQGFCDIKNIHCFSFDHATGKCLTCRNQCNHRVIIS